MFNIGDKVRIRTMAEILASEHAEIRNTRILNYFANSICEVIDYEPSYGYCLSLIEKMPNTTEWTFSDDGLDRWAWEEYELEPYVETEFKDNIDISTLLEGLV